MGFPVVSLVQAGLAAWTAYQCYTTGKNIVNDPKVQKSWEKRQYIDTFGHTVPHLPVFGDAMRGGRALAQGNSKAAYLWPANAIFTLYGGKVIGKGFRSIFNRVIPEINKLRFGRWINKQGGKVVKGGKSTGVSSSAQNRITINEKVSSNFAKHAFAKGRHSDLGLPIGVMASKSYKLIEKNLSLLKAGDNTLLVTINGVQKSFKAFVQDGKVMSINIYPGVSNRVTTGTLIDLGNIKW